MQPAGRPVGHPLRREAYVQRKARPRRITEFCLCYHRRRDPLAVGEATCEAAAAASAAACIEELLKSRRATAGVDGEEFTRLLGDDDADDGDSSPDADGDLSLANLPAEPNAIFLADGCCSGVAAGSDGLPAAAGLLDGDLRRLILVSGDDCRQASSSKQFVKCYHVLHKAFQIFEKDIDFHWIHPLFLPREHTQWKWALDFFSSKNAAWKEHAQVSEILEMDLLLGNSVPYNHATKRNNVCCEVKKFNCP